MISISSAIGLKRTRLLATEALLETGEDVLGGDRLDATTVDVVDSSLDLGLPVRTEVRGIQAGGQFLDQLLALLGLELERCLEDLFHRGGHALSVPRCRAAAYGVRGSATVEPTPPSRASSKPTR